MTGTLTRRRTAGILTLLASLLLGLNALLLTPSAGADDHKVWVCKMVGTPDDPRPQTGNNPIHVSRNSVTAQEGFSDAHPSFIVDGPDDPDCPVDDSNTDPSDVQVRPILECVVVNDDDTVTGYFGYLNETGRTVDASEVAQSLTGGTANPSLPTSFVDGRTPYVDDNGTFVPGNAAFSATGTEVVWTLDGRTATAGANGPLCPEDDTPPPPPPPSTPETWDLTVQKNVDGDAPPRSYDFLVQCDGRDDVILSLGDGEDDTVENLPEDIDCTVTETGTGTVFDTFAGTEADPDTETAVVTLEDQDADVTVYFLNVYEEDDTDVGGEVVEPAAAVAGSCDGVEVDLDNSESTQSVTFTVTINGDEQEITVPAGASDSLSGALGNNDAWSATVAVGDTVLETQQGNEDCDEEPTTGVLPDSEEKPKPAPKPAPQAEEEAEVLGVAQERLPRTGLGSGELFMLALLLLGLGATALMAPQTRRVR